jgi:hypothetical protein
MTNAKQATAKKMKMAERARHLKQLHFPEWADDYLWHRNRNDGYISIPRSMPIVMEAIDAMSKGQPAGHTLLTLWCRSPDHALLTIESPKLIAAETGFSGERQVDTWRRRMKKLEELGFIATKPGAAGDFHYVLLLNPNWAIELRRWRFNDVPESIYAKFTERLMDIGAYSEIETLQGHIAQWTAQQAAATAASVGAQAAPGNATSNDAGQPTTPPSPTTPIPPT